MFVKTTRRRRGDRSYEYLSLVETVREGDRIGHRTLLRLGEVSELRASGQLERIIAALRRHLDDNAERVDLDALAAEDARALGAVAVCESLWRDVGLDTWFSKVGADRGAELLAEAAFAMVANRLVAPSSKRRLPEWCASDVAMPAGWSAPSLDQYYRALDAVADSKSATETWLYGRLCDLANLDLRLVCYDLTSTYFETTRGPSARFPSRAFGYSRDHRSDRPQIVIGLLCTSDGLPIAHHVFAGNTNDVSTLPDVLEDLQGRFGVGRICVVADRGLVSAENIAALDEHAFTHVLATRLHRDSMCAAAISASAAADVNWVAVPDARSGACEVTVDQKRCVVVASFERWARDTKRTAELVTRTEAQLLDLEARVRAGRLVDATKIARAAQRILDRSGVARLFELEIDRARFIYHYNEQAHDYEAALAGRYVLTTNLTVAEASTAQVVLAYRQLQHTEARFRVLKDFLNLRPVRHWTERRVRGHVAICVYAAVLEALLANQLRANDVHDPDERDQHLTPARALRELARVRRVHLDADGRHITLVTRRNALQAHLLRVLGVDTTSWDRAQLH